jgi:hypothetical protein
VTDPDAQGVVRIATRVANNGCNFLVISRDEARN